MVIPTLAGTDKQSPTSALHRITASSDRAHHRLSKRQLMDLSAVLELWLDENQGNLYPTRHQKERIALDTSMSYNQVNRWFANRRRKQQLQFDQYDIKGSVTPSMDEHNDCELEVSCSSSLPLNNNNVSMSTTATTPTYITDNNNNNRTLADAAYESELMKMDTNKCLELYKAMAWANTHFMRAAMLNQQQQQQQQNQHQQQQFLIDNLILHQQKQQDALLTAGKQKLALLDAHNLTEQEHLAVAALTDLANCY